MTPKSSTTAATPDQQARIRERAYDLWIEDGSRDGQADEYWYRAEREILGHLSGDSEAAEQWAEDVTGGDGDANGSGEAAAAPKAKRAKAAAPKAAAPKAATPKPAVTAKSPAKDTPAPSLDNGADKPKRGRRPAANA